MSVVCAISGKWGIANVPVNLSTYSSSPSPLQPHRLECLLARRLEASHQPTDEWFRRMAAFGPQLQLANVRNWSEAGTDSEGERRN
jgi:hypothetical protein